jgi:hypothetical protein
VSLDEPSKDFDLLKDRSFQNGCDVQKKCSKCLRRSKGLKLRVQRRFKAARSKKVQIAFGVQ